MNTLDTFNQMAGTNTATTNHVFIGILLVIYLLIAAWALSSAYKGLSLDNVSKEEFVVIAIRLSVLFCILLFFFLS